MSLTTTRPAFISGGPIDHHIARFGSLAEALASAAGQSGERGVRFVDLDGIETGWSYRELYEHARRGAGALRGRGIEPGSRVILRLADPCEFMLALWTCLVGGYVAIPTNGSGALPDDAATLEAHLDSLKLLAPSAIILSELQRRQAAALLDQRGGSRLTLLDASDLRAGSAVADVMQNAGLDRLAAIFPTSGSSGVPKPVMQTEGAILGMCAGSAQMNGFDHTDVFLNWMPTEHVGSVVFLNVLPLVVGAAQVQVAHGLVRPAVLTWLDLLTRYRASVTWVPNYVFNMVARALAQGARGDWDLSAVRFLVNAGESISASVIQQFALRLQPFGLRGEAIRPAFGMSETCSGITWSGGLQAGTGRYVDLGAPIPGAALRIVGADGELLAEQQVGVLHVKGPSVTRGYFKAGRDDKFLEGGWFDTGDVGFVSEGRLFLTDREDDAIEIHGTRLHCYELEAAIEDLDGVLAGHAAVCCVQRDGQATLSAFYCPDPEAAPGEGLRARIETLLSEAAPRAKPLAMPLSPEQLPRTAIGKIQRKVLRRRLEAAVSQ